MKPRGMMKVSSWTDEKYQIIVKGTRYLVVLDIDLDDGVKVNYEKV